jgi:DNA helicase-2/ATP-dependent DNA helicase PcrA
VLPEALTNGDLAHGVGERIEQFRRLIESFRARVGQQPLYLLATELLKVVDYRSEIRRVHREQSDAEARWTIVEEFLNSIALYEQRHEDATLQGFLEETALAGRDDEKDDEKKPHALTLMTLHSAKGLEFPHVYLVGLEEGVLPHARSITEGRGIDEERRLCYVGVTRAQTTLTLSFAKGRTKWGKPRPSIPSRFLMEMRGDTERAQRAAAAAEALFRHGAGPKEEAPQAPATGKGKAKAKPQAHSSKARSSASKRASS